MDFISFHKCIKNTFTYGTVLTEHQLNASRRCWTLERTRKIPTYLRRMKERRKKEEERKWDGICVPFKLCNAYMIILVFSLIMWTSMIRPFWRAETFLPWCSDHPSWKLKQRRGSYIWGSLLTSRGFVGTEGEHLRLSGECETAGLWQTGQSETCTEGHATALHVPDWDMCLPVYMEDESWNMGIGE